MPERPLTCSACGSEQLVAEYYEAVYQGIVGVIEDGPVVDLDYDGAYESHDDSSGPNYAYRCLGCDRDTATLEALVGLAPDDEPHDPYTDWQAEETRRATVQS